MFWMPVEDPVIGGDQVRHDELGAFYENIKFLIRLDRPFFWLAAGLKPETRHLTPFHTNSEDPSDKPRKSLTGCEPSLFKRHKN
jgi:hypothetical protein